MKLTLGIWLFCLTVLSVRSDPQEYELTDYCGNQLYIDTSAILTANGYWTEGNCDVQVYSHLHMDGNDKLRLSFLALDVPCNNQHIQLYDGDTTTGTSLAYELCGYNKDDIVTDYLSVDENYITIRLYRDGYDEPTGKMLVTATAQYSYLAGDYICDNLFYVDSSLKCDGYDNCGDWSDEHDYECDNIDYSDVFLYIGTSTGVGLFAVLVCIVVAVTVQRRRRRIQGGLLYGGPQPGFAAGGPPPYGSVQQGGNPGHLPAPPPYYPSKNQQPYYHQQAGGAGVRPLPPNPYLTPHNAATPQPPNVPATARVQSEATVTTTTTTVSESVDGGSAGVAAVP